MKQPSLKQAFNRMHSDHAFYLQTIRDGVMPYARAWPVPRKAQSTLHDWGCFGEVIDNKSTLSAFGSALLAAWERQEEASKLRKTAPYHLRCNSLRAFCEANDIHIL